MILNIFKIPTLFLVMTLLISCGTKVTLPPQYWSLNDTEKLTYFGLLALDSTTARQYLNMGYPRERAQFLDEYWEGRDEDRADFLKRVKFTIDNFGQYGIINDERAKLWVRYGKPDERTIVESEKKRIGLTRVYEARPVEVWTYNNLNKEFDLIKSAPGGYKIIAVTYFNDSARVHWFEEVDSLGHDAAIRNVSLPDYDVSMGRFRQKKNLTRLEIYLGVELTDTVGVILHRAINVYNDQNKKVDSSYCFLIPRGGQSGYFVDQINLLLEPRIYRLEIVLTPWPDGERIVKNLQVDILDYEGDLKLISDLVKATLIDEGFTDNKFTRLSVTRMMPQPRIATKVGEPIYFFHEVYNLVLSENNNHRIRTLYRIIEKTTQTEQLVDFVVKINEDVGTTGYIGVKYHPMSLPPGRYIVYAETYDLIGERRLETVCEFELKF